MEESSPPASNQGNHFLPNQSSLSQIKQIKALPPRSNGELQSLPDEMEDNHPSWVKQRKNTRRTKWRNQDFYDKKERKMVPPDQMEETVSPGSNGGKRILLDQTKQVVPPTEKQALLDQTNENNPLPFRSNGGK